MEEREKLNQVQMSEEDVADAPWRSNDTVALSSRRTPRNGSGMERRGDIQRIQRRRRRRRDLCGHVELKSMRSPLREARGAGRQ